MSRVAAVRFRLEVDDAGEVLAATGDRLVVGHARAAAADLPFLADVEDRHLALERSSSLRGGPGWRAVPCGSARTSLGGRPIGSEGAELRHGDALELARNLRIRHLAPDPSSSSALLAMERGAECLGATRVLLLARGLAGRVRIGPGADRHLRVARLLADLELHLDGATLVLGSPEGLRSGAGAAAETLALDLRGSERHAVAVGSARGGRPPFGVVISPLGPVE